ncbi:MAG: ATP-binding cassette domain-containing protein [Planctomycetales bacterium]|nr:ATP-binding cassette domain-containing protein [Planctomycetales bacterium]
MPLVTLRDITIRFRGPALLDSVDCIIEPGQKIGLLGRNGAGKSTLMRMLTGQVEPDHGSISFSSGARVAFLQQEVPQDLHGSVAEVVRQGVRSTDDSDHDALADWEAEHRVEQVLSRMELDPEASVQSMSSGMKRRVLLAQTLVDEPDFLLLDEPTNHLDIEAIKWLEDFLGRWSATLMFVTHDRQFLRNLATRILEIEGGRLFDWSCDYDTFLRRKQEALAAEEKQNALFDKKLAAEEVWIRQGIKARRTRNEGRVRALKELRLVRGERRSKLGTTNLQIQAGERSGNLVAQLEDVCFSHQDGGKSVDILRDFSTTIMRGDKVGVIGSNGCGKTTLLKILLGKLEPQGGRVRLGSNLQIAYFDQLRDQLDDTKTVEEDVADGYQTIATPGGGTRHVLGYLQDFLFTPERARTLIGRLSGGERNRVLLAKLFAKPANVIILDEPTNDLDAETLEMLEERLIDYQGTLLVVSHDREFLNNVVTSCIVFEEEGVREYVGGYDDWLRQSNNAKDSTPTPSTPGKGRGGWDASLEPSESRSATTGTVPATKTPSSKSKLSYKETQELNNLPGRIEKLESQIGDKHEQMAAPDFYKRPKEEIVAEQTILDDLQQQLQTAYDRWSELEARQ